MASFNKVMLMGNMTRDPQLRYTPNQTAVVDFGLATNRKWKSGDGQMKEEVCFVDCTAFGKPAETINKYMSKGRPIFVEGRLTFDSWTGQDGTKRSKLKVTVEGFQFIGSPSGGGGQGGGNNAAASSAADDYADQTANQGPIEDDIPF